MRRGQPEATGGLECSLTSEEVEDDDSDSASSALFPADAEEVAAGRRGAGSCRPSLGDLLERPRSSPLAMVVHCCILGLILGSTTLTIVETIPEMRGRRPEFTQFDHLVTAVFTVEFILRTFCSDSVAAFCCNGYNVIDFFAIAPGYVELVLLVLAPGPRLGVHKAAGSLRALRFLRLVRLVRVLRIFRFMTWPAVQQLKVMLKIMSSVMESGIFVIIILMCTSTVIAASLIYLFESVQCLEVSGECNAQSHFNSIPSAFWWSVVTLTTVGYGDMVPSSTMGKVVGGLTAICGALLLALGAALVSVHVRDSWLKEKSKASFREHTAELSVQTAQAAELEKLELLVSRFQASLDALVTRVTSAAMHQDAGDASPSMVPLLRSLKEHSGALSSEVYASVCELLRNVARTQLQADQSANLVPPPSLAGVFDCRSPPARPRLHA